MLPLIILLAAVAGFLWWKGHHPYVVTREEMKAALERTLEKKMPEEEWHKLVHTHISRDRYLESLRQQLIELPRKTHMEADAALYDPPAMAKIASLLDELRKKRA